MAIPRFANRGERVNRGSQPWAGIPGYYLSLSSARVSMTAIVSELSRIERLEGAGIVRNRRCCSGSRNVIIG